MDGTSLSGTVATGAEVGDLDDLMAILRDWTPDKEGFNTLLLVSFSTLGLPQEQKSVLDDLDSLFLEFAVNRGGIVCRLSNLEVALLLPLNEFNQVETMVDLKVDVMREIQQSLPAYFSKIDQTKLIRPIDLGTRLAAAQRFVETYADRSRDTKVDTSGRRPLKADDIERLREALRKLGPKGFADRYIRSQTAALVMPGKGAKPFMTEYFVSLGELSKGPLAGIEVAGAGNLFNQLTLTLDTAMLYCFRAAADREKCSINLNVETVFTHAFQHFLKEGGDRGLQGVMIEFRQDNVFQNFNQFATACDLIQSKGGTVAIDRVQPETLGVVNLHRMKANLAKVIWEHGADEHLTACAQDIRAMQEGGTVMLLAHVDDKDAIRLGHGLGVTMFQGYAIDGLLGTAQGGSGR